MPNPDAVPDRDFKKLNKMSLKEKALKPHQVSQYRQSHDARKTDGKIITESKTPTLPSTHDPSYIYGRKTEYVFVIVIWQTR